MSHVEHSPKTPPPTTSRLTRRTFAAGLVGAAAAVPLGAAPAHAAGPTPSTTRWARRAATSYAALRTYFAADHGLYREQYPVGPDDRPYSYEWPFSQAHVAALDLSGMAGVGARYRDALSDHRRAQQLYWKQAGSTGLPGFASYVTPPHGDGGDFFYDDNEWVALADLQHNAMYRDRGSVAQARQLFDLVVSGWDTDESHAAPGGVFWTQAPWSSDRNTVSNMPGAQIGLRLHQLTGRPSDLEWSLRMYRWTNQYLQRPDGLYHDHLDLLGTVEKTIWSYNQGVPVSVNALLSAITGERHYLDEAVRIADAAADFYGQAEGNRTRLDAQPPFFNSIYFKNLLRLESITGGQRHRRAMEEYAERTWDTRRDPRTGLFSFGEDAEVAGRTQMIEQAAMVQILAVLGWSPDRHRLLY
ncbi:MULTISPECIES: glycoside hydrolase family 76 protein [unclassified Knoellia]|uniref:glycoside hydrolase family 76 protein n=1 Tax=Knoellia altitudinis TaxID=3404795 RepID=UPI003605D109